MSASDDEAILGLAREQVTRRTLEGKLDMESGTLILKRLEPSEEEFQNTRHLDYAKFLVSEDHNHYRNRLPLNKQFREEAERVGINLENYFGEVRDDGIKLDISKIKTELAIEDSQNNQRLKKCHADLKQLLEEMNTTAKAFYQQIDATPFGRLMRRELHTSKTPTLEITVSDEEDCGLNEILDTTKEYTHRTSIVLGTISQIEEEILPLYHRLAQSDEYSIRDGLRKKGTAESRSVLRFLEATMSSSYINFKAKADRIKKAAEQIEEEEQWTAEPAEVAINQTKYEGHDAITYFIKRETAHPQDILLGSYGGIWIDTDVLEEETPRVYPGVVYAMLDQSVVFFGIYQQIGVNPPERTGAAVAIAAINEQEKPVLALSSIHLSQTENPRSLGVLNPLYDHIRGVIIDFAKTSKFTDIAVSNWDWNSATKYGNGRVEKPLPGSDLLKLPDAEQPEFYQEIFRHKEQQFQIRDDEFSLLILPK